MRESIKRRFIQQGKAVTFKLCEVDGCPVWRSVIYPYTRKQDIVDVTGNQPAFSVMVAGPEAARKVIKRFFNVTVPRKLKLSDFKE